MSWLFDAEGSLLNLDKVERLSIEKINESENYGLFAWLSPDDECMIMEGTQQQCNNILAQISFKLHRITYG